MADLRYTDPDAPASRRLTETELLDLVQRQTLRYFWDFGHPVSGMARERSGGTVDYDIAETVTTGGTGFGVMAMIAGAERGFLPREAVAGRVATICDFLSRTETYGGAFAHWLNGTTGETVAFSPNDDGGDIIETAFLMMGLLAAREYFAARDPALAATIDGLWRAVRWSDFCPDPATLMWHLRPDDRPGGRFAQNLPVTGWHEGLIAFVLGAGAPVHPLDPRAYHDGWASGGWFRNGRSFHGIPLPLGPDEGGPMFFSHYSFLGLDPRGLTDRYADYAAQTLAHARINHAHCLANPGGFRGYGPAWGLTACDGDKGYDAFSPTNDRGVIAPTGAIASMPYLPAEALAALRHYHEDFDGSLWSDCGFRDAFNETAGWVADSCLAIDQGPIVVMIENYRSGLLWRLFMGAPEVQQGLRRLGFSSPRLGPPAIA